MWFYLVSPWLRQKHAERTHATRACVSHLVVGLRSERESERVRGIETPGSVADELLAHSAAFSCEFSRKASSESLPEPETVCEILSIDDKENIWILIGVFFQVLCSKQKRTWNWCFPLLVFSCDNILEPF